MNDLIEKTEELIAEKICNDLDHATVSVADLRSLVEAAQLLADIHEMADCGELDGVDLDWMVKADSLVLGVEEESA